jgi:CubicO group peptidase (beta-lactamase class C family)
VILSRIAQDAVGGDATGYIKTRLFEPLGMSSAVIEADEHGTLVGSSYMYATARDWARYGQFLVQDGVWQGQALLPAGYVEMMAAPVASSHGQYGQGQVWRWESESQANGLPKDTFWMSGHDGQYVAIIPSRQVVIVRMGLTPESQGYAPQPLVKAVLDASSTSP